MDYDDDVDDIGSLSFDIYHMKTSSDDDGHIHGYSFIICTNIRSSMRKLMF